MLTEGNPVPRGEMRPPTNRLAPTAKHEKRDVYAPGVLLFLVIIAFGALVVHAGIWGWLRSLKDPRAGDPAINQRLQTASWPRTAQNPPRLQVAPSKDWRTYRAEQERQLKSYGWMDRTAEVVRIPIEEAINRIVDYGLPYWGPTNRVISPQDLQKQRAGESQKAKP
jgi:hypothetical protein